MIAVQTVAIKLDARAQPSVARIRMLYHEFLNSFKQAKHNPLEN